MTKIEWTEKSWNPIVGCTIKSPGCKHCYAMGMAYRLEAMGPKPDGSGNIHLDHYTGTTELSRKGKPVWTGKLGFNEKAWLEPLRRKKPTMYFVNSMGDLFHEDCPDEWIDRVFAVMALAPQHTFQVLTKRSARMREYFDKFDVSSRVGLEVIELTGTGLPEPIKDRFRARSFLPLPNVWLGVSVEDQARADERVPDLLATPAAVRWLSCEPLLGPVDLTLDGLVCDDCDHCQLTPQDPETGLWECRRCDDTGKGDEWGIDWVVVGGESGPGARPMHSDWARSLRDQCETAGVPFFFKQWGEWLGCDQFGLALEVGDDPEISRFDHREWDEGQWGAPSRPMWCDWTNGNIDAEEAVIRVGKKRAGRLLDGVTHDGMPEVLA